MAKPTQFVIKKTESDHFYMGLQGGIPQWGDRTGSKRHSISEVRGVVQELRLQGELVDLQIDG